LAERFQLQRHRARRRTPQEDWTLLVRAFNFAIEGKAIQKLQISDVWPRVGETAKDFERRARAVVQARYQARHLDKLVPERLAAEARRQHRRIAS